MTPPRVVIDANLHYSAQIGEGRGPVHALRDKWLSGEVRPLASPQILKDMENALRKEKLNLPEGRAAELLNEFKAHCEVLEASKELRLKLKIQFPCRDNKDQCYLDLAYAAKADALISGDKDLHAVAGDFPVPILTAGDFLRRFFY